MSTPRRSPIQWSRPGRNIALAIVTAVFVSAALPVAASGGIGLRLVDAKTGVVRHIFLGEKIRHLGRDVTVRMLERHIDDERGEGLEWRAARRAESRAAQALTGGQRRR